MASKNVIFDGFEYRIQDGYYIRCGASKVYLHRAIWEKLFGPIPEGCVIHHVDFDSLNNSPENLQCITRSEHNSIHDSARKPMQKICANCGKMFLAIVSTTEYCSGACSDKVRYHNKRSELLEQKSEYYRKNREKILMDKRQYYILNRTAILDRRKNRKILEEIR
ncbi:MAG: HNH endonuclease signature motif containing protein [Dehalococcoidia bacterium]